MLSLNRRIKLKIYLLAGLALVVSGCSTSDTKQARVLTPIDIELGAETRPLAFRKVVIKIPRNVPIGEIQAGWLCIKQSDLKVRGGRYQLDDELFTDVFRDEFERNGYRLVGDPDALFEDRSLSEAEFLVAALITDIEANVCYTPSLGFGDVTTNAKVYLEAEWQVYSTLDRKVVFTTSTDGNANSDNDADTAFGEAFAIAAQNLLANKEFHQLLTIGAPLGPAFSGESLQIAGLRSGSSGQLDLVALRASVVTVRSPLGHGSGFFLSEDGYLLTNEHVVKDASLVRVVLSSGREVPADVIRTDSRRDVALLKVPNEGFVPVFLASNEPDVGADVYVLGSPLEEDLQGTVSKGIISGYRVERGQRYLQSDVNVQPGSSGGPMVDGRGNVVGLTVSGLSSVGGTSVGLNFFVPISEALSALKVGRTN